MVAPGKLNAGEAARAEAAPLGVVTHLTEHGVGSEALPTKAQENLPQPGIEIEGLDHEYPSCVLVQFSVRNTSQREVCVEVYAEEFKASAEGALFLSGTLLSVRCFR